jgi:hypothetical protein
VVGRNLEIIATRGLGPGPGKTRRGSGQEAEGDEEKQPGRHAGAPDQYTSETVRVWVSVVASPLASMRTM